MRPKRPMWLIVRMALVLTAFLGVAQDKASGQSKERRYKIPVVMEKATIRGKVVILETRRDDRKTIANLRIQVWSTAKDDPGTKRSMEHETKTDDGGLFALPLLEEGRYILVVGELQLSLSVVPQSEDRKGASEPKVLLLLLPKDVI